MKCTQVELNLSLLEDISDDIDFCFKLAKEESVIILPGTIMKILLIFVRLFVESFHLHIWRKILLFTRGRISHFCFFVVFSLYLYNYTSSLIVIMIGECWLVRNQLNEIRQMLESHAMNDNIVTI